MKYICPQHMQFIMQDPTKGPGLLQHILQDGSTALADARYRRAQQLLGTAFEIGVLRLSNHKMIYWRDIEQLMQAGELFLLALENLEEEEEAEHCLLFMHRATLEALHAPAEGTQQFVSLVALLEHNLTRLEDFLQARGKHAQASHLRLTSNMMRQQVMQKYAH